MDILLVSSHTSASERSLIERILKDHGVGVREVTTYKKALEELARDKFTVVLLYAFNVSNDIGVTDAIRIMKQIVPDVLLVAVSDEKPLELEKELRQSGLYYYLTKPITDGELTEALSGAIETQMRRKAR